MASDGFKLSSGDLRQLRVSLTSFMEHLQLVIETLHEFGPPFSDQYDFCKGVSYLPQKYWAVALPIYVGVSVAVFVFIYPALNLMLTPPFNDLRTICDSHAVDVNVKPKQTGIPPVSDIPISD
ncbi:Phosphatidylinositol N-acetylglucosaminyltransferase subunit P, partial [Gryllus bimaculatus]